MEKISYLNDGSHAKHIVQTFYHTMVILAKKYETILKTEVLALRSQEQINNVSNIIRSESDATNHPTQSSSQIPSLSEDQTRFLYLFLFFIVLAGTDNFPPGWESYDRQVQICWLFFFHSFFVVSSFYRPQLHCPK